MRLDLGGPRDHSIDRRRPSSYDPMPNTVRHFIVKWDAERKQYVCDCGHASTSATEHEQHANEDQARRAREARRQAWAENVA